MRSWRGVFARRWLHFSLIPRSLVPALIALATVAGSIGVYAATQAWRPWLLVWWPWLFAGGAGLVIFGAWWLWWRATEATG